VKYEPGEHGMTKVIPETLEEEAAVAYIREHVPFFAGSENGIINGFLAGAQWGIRQERHESSHDGAWEQGCVLCDAERQAEGQVFTPSKAINRKTKAQAAGKLTFNDKPADPADYLPPETGKEK
jgi:hypothetical protein